ncbi:MAG: hypothetical protein H8E14_17530 [Candidatus Marinimicrobia bacterium]|nr:hypothetical protein [Candidatus Neomarinimicrobiota bacterium]
MGGKPIAEERSLEFDLLVCTRSDSFDRATNLTTNLQLAGQVAEYLEANPEFSKDDYGYNINQNDVDAELLLQDDRYTIIALHLVVGKYDNT